MPHQESIAQLKQAIKDWEHEFQRSNNRIPTRLDIKIDPKIYELYKTYKALKSRTNSADKIRNKKTLEPSNVGIDINILESQSDVEDVEEFNIESAESSSSQLKNQDTELGPTPQANGKVLSILDIRLTPPDSSPLKNKTGSRSTGAYNNQIEQAPEDTFKTPTKTRVDKISLLELTPTNNRGSRNKSLTQKLEQASYVKNTRTEMHTPQKNITSLLHNMETPQYLAKVNNKFNFDMDDQLDDNDNQASENLATSSPTKKITSIRSNIIDPITPTKLPAPLNFQVSPSPLKPHRLFSFGNNRKLSEIFNDYKNIREDPDLATSIENADDDPKSQDSDEVIDEGSSTSAPKRKRITQKRTTRRWKIKPNAQESKEDILKNVNIHDEVKRLDNEALKNLVDYMKVDDMDEEDLTSSDEEYVQQDPNHKDMKGKVKPVRMNYQRLKINDPRIKKFKKRMQNRR
ncbi:DNA replication regulator SLD2 [Debaryomyces fabryi]|uniref:DNA replication regulator SLD2 n=1 Tax=Debaryomyces fabryi TaxID=58627 RepID=A0A0V1PS67_9ASCO|nr:DNA replication regulator SLD2 [Debaryomyces fabryi]KRZ99009.1 DNA replication regulator SLD2 [Debaryomyces fabryi]CUM49320.1 unnamed protein product [Debaryomyces fabryi]